MTELFWRGAESMWRWRGWCPIHKDDSPDHGATMAQPWRRRWEHGAMLLGPDLGLNEVLIDQVLARRLADDVPVLMAHRAKVEDSNYC